MRILNKILISLFIVLSGISCGREDDRVAMSLLDDAAEWQYRQVDTAALLARRALAVARSDRHLRAEAYNRLAAVEVSKMNLNKAFPLLDSARSCRPGMIEQLGSDVIRMRIYQRMSRNKEFYECREQAHQKLLRIREEQLLLTVRERKRMEALAVEYKIFSSTYLHYIGLEQASWQEMASIDPSGELRRDTLMLLSYWYNMGAGGVSDDVSAGKTQQEMDYLMHCWQVAATRHSTYWEANALQAISEHLLRGAGEWGNTYYDAVKILNTDAMPDSLLAGNLAQRALEMFTSCGDVYQVSASYRTLAECYFAIGDYRSALICLQKALYDNKKIKAAPALVASLYEQLCMVYSALNDKPHSDYYRNLYLDLQYETRQDKQIEARIDQLRKSEKQQNILLVTVVGALIGVVLMLVWFTWKRQRQQVTTQKLLAPLRKWQEQYSKYIKRKDEQRELIEDTTRTLREKVYKSKCKHMEQRAKIALVNSVTPLIERMQYEANRLCKQPHVSGDDLQYLSELCQEIESNNLSLTKWIQLRQGIVTLHIESFPVQQLFKLVAKGATSFQMKGIDLTVHPTDAVVKADRVLTLFMINTLADNARKFTPSGGSVEIAATETDEYVEISVSDTGKGLSPSRKAVVFGSGRLINPHDYNTRQEVSHGFGLANCKGIIEQYRKLSRRFECCSIDVESEQGKGSRFFFRLPKGIVRTLLAIVLSFGTLPSSAMKATDDCLNKAKAFADSAYFNNVKGQFEQSLAFSDSCIYYLNAHYRKLFPRGKHLMTACSDSNAVPAEIIWSRENVPTDYRTILDIRNESAVAALALHEWDLYNYHNRVYIQLFRERSADTSLSQYARNIKQSETNKTIAIVVLSLLLLSIFPLYYIFYYRNRLFYRFSLDKLNEINSLLLDAEKSPKETLEQIKHIWESNKYASNPGHSDLQSVVSEIMNSLQQSVDGEYLQEQSVEFAEDEQHRAEYEQMRLHVSNNVIDNCLSTLKHETMYYPSRIKQLLDSEGDVPMPSVLELITYYKELYKALSEQAMRQVQPLHRSRSALSLREMFGYETDEMIEGDREYMTCLVDLLRDINGSELHVSSCNSIDERYVEVVLRLAELPLSPQQRADLFSSNSIDVRFLICKQIIRDIGDSTGAHGCGVSTLPDDGEKGTSIRLVLPKSQHKGRPTT